ncbi:siderophore-interacting protein [uncultured Paracoccus sp.]|uniref:siderophore-interacting protein n=1 Tax=uncultured Paracoccus sp. TaxID=189685 RepID=UPI0025E75662|nr:siderophore-interacting protein [uncultured Paracoccus sp.]
MTETTFRNRAVVVLDDAGRVLDELLDHMSEHATVTRTDDGARLESPFGTVDILRLSETVLVDVVAPSVEILALIRAFIAEHVFEFAGEGTRIDWSGDGLGDSLPPQFRLLRVTDAFDLTPRMRRVVFACDTRGLDAPDAGYHIRLLLPPEGREPRWPVQRADGRLDWPQGKDALVSRVYTIREVNADAGTIAIDFVLHEGGASPGADFARRAQVGNVVGLMGPGGDGRPEGRRLLLLGDEAALPAIARMIAEMPAATEIDAFIEVTDAAEEQALTGPARLALTWLHRGGTPAERSTLLDETLAARLAGGDLPADFVWAGCEKAVAARLRKALLSHHPNRKKPLRVYAYWSRTP